MKRILWISKHEPEVKQFQALEEKFGPVIIIQVKKTVEHACEVVDLFKEYKADEMVVVLPIPILAELTNLKICPVLPIRASMERIEEDGHFEIKFSHFERVHKVEVNTIPL